jgi:hypothetical protein
MQQKRVSVSAGVGLDAGDQRRKLVIALTFGWWRGELQRSRVRGSGSDIVSFYFTTNWVIRVRIELTRIELTRLLT